MKPSRKDIVSNFWQAYEAKNWDAVAQSLDEDFVSHWVVTDEYFDKTGYMKVNSDFPGKWNAKIIKYEETDKGSVCVVFSNSNDSYMEFYLTAFISFKDNKIHRMEEYWSTVEKAPAWRKEYWKREDS